MSFLDLAERKDRAGQLGIEARYAAFLLTLRGVFGLLGRTVFGILSDRDVAIVTAAWDKEDQELRNYWSAGVVMIEEIMTHHHSTRARVSAMIDYMEGNIATYSDIDRQLILVVPSSFEEENHLRDISLSIQDHFREVFRAGQSAGDLNPQHSPDILSDMIVGTLNNIMSSWARSTDYPIFNKLEEARALYDALLSQA